MKINTENYDKIDFREFITPKPSGWQKTVSSTKIVLERAAASKQNYRSALSYMIATSFVGLSQLDTVLKVIDVAREKGVFSENFGSITIEDIFVMRSNAKLSDGVFAAYLKKHLNKDCSRAIAQQIGAIEMGFDRLAVTLSKNCKYSVEQVPITTLFAWALNYGKLDSAKRIIDGYRGTIKKEIESQSFLKGQWGNMLPGACAIKAGKIEYIDTLISLGYDINWEKPNKNASDTSWPLFAAVKKGDLAAIDYLFSKNVECKSILFEYIDYITVSGIKPDLGVIDKIYSRKEIMPSKGIGSHLAYAIRKRSLDAYRIFKDKGEILSAFLNFCFAHLPDRKAYKDNLEKAFVEILNQIDFFKLHLRDEDFPALFAQVLKFGQLPNCDSAKVLDTILSIRSVYEQDGEGRSQLVWEGMESASDATKAATSLDGHAKVVLGETDQILRTFGSFANLSTLLNTFPYGAGKSLQAPQYEIFINDNQEKLKYLAGCFDCYDMGSIMSLWGEKWSHDGLRFLELAPIDEKKLWPPLAEGTNKEPLPLETLLKFLDGAEISNEERRQALTQGLSGIIQTLNGGEAIIGMPNAETDYEEYQKWCADFKHDLGVVMACAQGDKDKELSLVSELGLAGHHCATAWRECVDHFYTLFVDKRGSDIPSQIYEKIAEKLNSIVNAVASEFEGQVGEELDVHLPNAIANLFAETFGFKPRRYTFSDSVLKFNDPKALISLKKEWNSQSLMNVFQALDKELAHSEVTLLDWVLDNIPKTYTTIQLEALASRFAPYKERKNVRDALLASGVRMLNKETPEAAVSRTLLAKALLYNQNHPLWENLSVDTHYCFKKGFSARPTETFEEALSKKKAELNEDRSKKRRIDDLTIRKFKEEYVEDVLRGNAKWSEELQSKSQEYLTIPAVQEEYAPILALPNIEDDLASQQLGRQKPTDTLEDVLANERRDSYREMITNPSDGLQNTRGIWGAIVAESLIRMSPEGDLTLPPFSDSYVHEEAVVKEILPTMHGISTENLEGVIAEKRGIFASSAPMEIDPQLFADAFV